jgi:hypothetical protein
VSPPASASGVSHFPWDAARAAVGGGYKKVLLSSASSPGGGAADGMVGGAALEQVRLAVFDFDKTLTVEHAHRGYHLTGNSALHESLFGGRDRMGQLASMFVGESLCLCICACAWACMRLCVCVCVCVCC